LYEDDYRFSPDDTDVEAYIYVRESDVHTFYPAGVTITLQGGLSGFASSVLLSAASILAYSIF